ncbi:MAG: hypothetical protein WBA23_00860 [Tunicatimonas sp.]|uniref:hypothetical protein n=1 Tax=Tunicatimonas sp. TaxID=1940096 RepID=UPI003C713ADD
MDLLFAIQNDLLLGCLIITFIAFVISGTKVGIALFRGETADTEVFRIVTSFLLVFGFLHLLGSFLP